MLNELKTILIKIMDVYNNPSVKIILDELYKLKLFLQKNKNNFSFTFSNIESNFKILEKDYSKYEEEGLILLDSIDLSIDEYIHLPEIYGGIKKILLLFNYFEKTQKEEILYEIYSELYNHLLPNHINYLTKKNPN